MFIPKKIKVGFQKRDDTYTKKLSYVIYYDAKGKLRKETSWESWRDKKTKPEEYDNTPIEGFVLNRNVGGVRESYSWNARLEKVRVFDPRGFEFEITIENMLFILQECTSVKGKGLEGEFVYAWNGPELALMPVCCAEYKKATAFTELQGQKIGVKEMIPGCSYKTKKQEDLLYLGRFNWYEMKSVNDPEGTALQIAESKKKDKARGYSYDEEHYSRYHRSHKFTTTTNKFHIFINETGKKVSHWRTGDGKGKYVVQAGLVALAAQNTNTCVDNYAELMEKFSKTKMASAPTGFSSTKKGVVFPKDHTNRFADSFYIKVSDTEYKQYSICAEHENSWEGNKHVYKLKGYRTTLTGIIKFENGVVTLVFRNEVKNELIHTQEAVAAMPWTELYVELASGSKASFNKYKEEYY